MRTLKVCLGGEARVGKSSLVRRFVLNQFREAYVTTLGTNVLKHPFRVRDPATGVEEDVQLVLWDIMGDRTIRDLLREAFFSGASGLLAVCDVTRRETATALGDWVKAARGVAGTIPATVVANKIDLPAVVPHEALEDLAVGVGAPILFTSAKTGDGVVQAFEDLARRALADAG